MKPELDPHWPVEIAREGDTVTELTWTAASEDLWISNEQVYVWGVSMKMPDSADEALHFPVIQICEEGQISWIQIPEEGQNPHDLDEPAPAVTLVAGGDSHGGQEDDAEEHAAADEQATAEETATEEAAAGDDTDQGDATDVALGEQAADSASGTDPLTWVALAVAVLGVLVGAGSMLVARRAAS